MWFVALSHRPHFPSLPLPMSVSLSPSLDVKRILPSFLRQRPSHRETQQNSLPPMTHSTTSRAPLHTTRSPATTAHLTTPRPGSQSTARLPQCLSLCLSVYLPVLLPVFFCLPGCHFLYLSALLLSCQDVSLFTCLYAPICLPVFLPACTVYLNTP